MKKSILFFIAIFAILFTGDLWASNLIQDPAGSFDFQSAFVNGTALAGTVTVIVDLLKNSLPNIFKGSTLMWTGYLMPVILAFIGWKLKWGFLAEYQEWWIVLIVGVLSSIGSWFAAYLGIANIILQALGIDLKGYRQKARSNS